MQCLATPTHIVSINSSVFNSVKHQIEIGHLSIVNDNYSRFTGEPSNHLILTSVVGICIQILLSDVGPNYGFVSEWW